MNAAVIADTLAAVTNDSTDPSRGAEIRRRMEALGMGPTDLAKEAAVARKSLYRVMDDDPTVTEKTVQRVESTLTRLEYEFGHGGPDAILSTEQGLIEFEVTGDFGVRVVVKGPIENADELERQVSRLIRDIRESRPGANGGAHK